MAETLELFLLPQQAANGQEIKKIISKKLTVPSDDFQFSIRKRSIDARSKPVRIRLEIEIYYGSGITSPKIPERKYRNVSNSKPVLIIGCGPAGMFAALRLIELGLKPVIIERGKNVRDRRVDLAKLARQRIVNPDSNYCFGEGGAGTYSDGKLYTRSSKRGSIQSVLSTFIEFGAHADIAIDAHPHIGTNKLPQIVSALNKKIVECGGEIHFNTKLKNFIISSGKLSGINVSQNNSPALISFQAGAVILATGHSARDIFYLLHHQKIIIEPKTLAIGVRVEHPQSLIDSIQYHCKVRNEFLPPASYSLTSDAGGRGVYSFCMCPGGIIAAAATDANEVVVNGWSPSRRNNPFANAGLVVTINETDVKDYEYSGALKFLEYQKAMEQKAFIEGGGNLSAPAQRMTDFIKNNISADVPKCSYIPGIASAPLHEILPSEISVSLKIAIKEFGKKMKGYLTNEAVLVGVESRTSSPVRIPRDKNSLMHPQIEGLFPCGEGAGYAGGIVSAAMDGERCAEAAGKFLKE